ncbi:MAG: hypothetical protein OEU46_13280 [Alphaproteobacteria bacterium]|nr:hypothetical protein [Alphaproteobacteria bacterium]
MARKRTNYRVERMQRDQAKAAKKREKEERKRAGKNEPAAVEVAEATETE